MTSEERLAEIRRAWGAEVRELFAMLDEVRANMRAVIAAAYPAEPDATPTTKELCEHIGALHDAVASAEKRAEDAERKLAAIVAADREFNRLALDGGALGDEFCRAQSAVDSAIRNASHVAERHDRKVRVNELRRMAEQALAADNDCPFYGEKANDARVWLLDEADRIERGEA